MGRFDRGIVLGEREYARRLLSGRELNEQEQSAARRLRRRTDWAGLVRAAEQARGRNGAIGRSGMGTGVATE